MSRQPQPPAPEPVDSLITIRRAAELLGGISPGTIYRYATRGELALIKLGPRSTRVRLSAVQRLIEAREKASPQALEDASVEMRVRSESSQAARAARKQQAAALTPTDAPEVR